jgi:tetratricopeptide (TPR) repeat protein
MRARFSTSVLVALAALATGALGIAVTLATTDSAKWPAWLRPYHRLGWWAVLALLLAAAVLSVWQYIHQASSSSGGSSTTSVKADDSGPAAGQDVTITGGHAPTAGRDNLSVIGGRAPTAGRDLYISPGEFGLPGAAPGGEARWPTPDKSVSNVGPRNPAFTGRQELLADLARDLAADGTAAVVQAKAIHGLGGIGKTQLVLEYAHRHTGDYDLIWWVTADQPATIPGQLVALARRLNIPEAADQAETVGLLLDELRRHGRWLLIFDNAEHPKDLRPYWPAGGRGHVLVTSRNPAWTGWTTSVEVDVLPRADSVAFLGRHLGRDDLALDRLAEALGDLPLALEQAAAYLEMTATTVDEYLDLFATRADELFQLGQPATTEQTITTVWSVSLQRLRAQTPAAEDLLRLCAFLAADNIPRSLPADHPDVLPERLAATVRDPLGYQQAIGALRTYSLIKVSQDRQALSLHRLVQAVTRQRLNPEQQRQWATATLRLLYAAFPQRLGDADAWPDYARLLPHALAVVRHTEAGGIDLDHTASLVREAGFYFWRRAEHQQAQRLLERALAIHEARYGADHPTTAGSLNNLANVLVNQGDLERARALFERALSIFQVRLGSDHPDTAQNLNNLANVLMEQGNLEGARMLFERAVTIREVRLGPDYPETAESLNNLAIVLAEQGDLDGALPLVERALGSFQVRLGPDHPSTASSLSTLANVLVKRGDPEGARALIERAVGIYEVRLGPDHPLTARSRQHLAALVDQLETRT